MKNKELILTGFETNEFMFIAHRGMKSEYPENTLAAFKAALHMVPMLELDVTFTSDHEIVVIHDDTLDRTTNGHGPVNLISAVEIKKLSAGQWFHPAYALETVPTLREVFELTGGQILINIEIKSIVSKSFKPAMEERILQLIKDMNIEDTVLISSFNWKMLENIRNLNSSIRLGLISNHVAAHNALPFCQDLQVFSWNPCHEELSQDQVDLMHTEGMRIYAYTVNSPKDASKMLLMGVDGIFSDQPLYLKNVLTNV